MLQALIFDVDGTLADTEEYHRLAFNQSFSQAGLNWHWPISLYDDLLGVTGGVERIHHYIQQQHPNFSQEAKIVDLQAYVQELHRVKTALYKQKLQQGVALRPGVQRLITEAHRSGMRLAIATTTSMENVSTLINCTLGKECLSWFEVIVSGDMVTRKKPAADVYISVLERLSLPASQCMALEDSQLGLQSALAAEIKTVITQNQFTRNHDFQKAALVIDHLGEPGQPFNVVQGNAHGHQYADLAMLEKIFSSA